jgi:hypothetical protein
LETLAQNPAFARTFLVEVLAAGPDALERRTEVHERFARLLAEIQRAARADVPALPDLGPHVFRACVGAINELATEEVLKGRVDRLPRARARGPGRRRRAARRPSALARAARPRGRRRVTVLTAAAAAAELAAARGPAPRAERAAADPSRPVSGAGGRAFSRPLSPLKRC